MSRSMRSSRRIARAVGTILAAWSVLYVSALPAAEQGAGTQARGSTAAADDARADVLSRLPPLITPETDRAIRRGLDFLIQRQASDGSWSEAGRGPFGAYSVSMTALSAMSLAASGSTPMRGPFAPHLNRAVTYLLKSQQTNGLICRRGEEEVRSMYGHGFSMLFLGQMLGMEADPERMAEIRRALARGVELTGRAQSPLGGWIYTPDSGGDEGSVTITQVQALRSCRDAGLAVPKRVINEAMGYLDKSIQPDGGIAYRVGMAGSRAPITAAAVACWFNAGMYDDPRARRALNYCKKTVGIGPGQQGVWGHYFYAHLYLSQVMYLAGEDEWRDYFPRLRDHLLSVQNEDGSWDGDSVGQVYGTALALTILQLPYNYLPIYQR